MKKWLLAGVISSAAVFAQADDHFSFDYVQAGYATLDMNTRAGDPDEYTGFQLAGSYSLNENFFVAGEYNATSEAGVDVTFSKFGLGYTQSVNDSLAYYTQVSHMITELGSRMAGDFEDKGTQFDVGLRFKMADNFELKGAVEHLRDADKNRTFFVVGGVFHMSESFAAFADVKTESDSDMAIIGMRYSF